jgi:hypothetical protein
MLHLLFSGGHVAISAVAVRLLKSKPTAVRNLLREKKNVWNGRRHGGEFGEFDRFR